jgi:hypothetical protein
MPNHSEYRFTTRNARAFMVSSWIVGWAAPNTRVRAGPVNQTGVQRRLEGIGLVLSGPNTLPPLRVWVH